MLISTDWGFPVGFSNDPAEVKGWAFWLDITLDAIPDV